MNCHVQQKVKVGKTVCDEASVVPWEVHSRDKVHTYVRFNEKGPHNTQHQATTYTCRKGLTVRTLEIHISIYKRHKTMLWTKKCLILMWKCSTQQELSATSLSVPGGKMSLCVATRLKSGNMVYEA